MRIYRPGQLLKIQHVLPKNLDWLLLGGPADGNEAQTFHKLQPTARIMGFEPNPVLYNAQLELQFPGTLLPIALWNSDTELSLRVDCTERKTENRNRSSSVVHHSPANRVCTVPARSLDSLSEEYGPFNNAMLWLDIEGAELDALRGAVGLLQQGAVRFINVEAFSHVEQEITDYLSNFGFIEVHHWNSNRDRRSGRQWCDICYWRINE